MTRSSISSLLMILAATLGYSNGYAEDHQVAKKDNSVQKNGNIDFDDAEPTDAESFLMVAGGRFKIISKTFTPPNNFTFKSFGNTHVDIKTDPQGVAEPANPDSPTQIKIRATFLTTNAGVFPLQGEGNLNTSGSGGSGGSGSTPEFHWSAKVRDVKVDLQIYHGQSGALVPEDSEETVGAFTVANMNDTDVDGAIDNTQSTVAGEVDLMRMVLKKPDPDLGGKVTLKRVGGSAKVFTSATKETEVTLPVEYNSADLDKTLWVEAVTTSASLRDIGFELSYKGKTDTVNATGVWSQMDAIASANQTLAALKAQPGWNELTNPPETLFTTITGGFVGLNPVSDRSTPKITNSIMFRFRLMPTGVGRGNSANIVKFDNTRQVNLIRWKTEIGSPNTIIPGSFIVDKTFPAGDVANDDTDADGSTEPTAHDYIFSADTPGFTRIASPLNAGFIIFHYQFNAYEYMRVRVDGTKPTGNALVGSRASVKSPWHVSHALKDVVNADLEDQFFRTTGDAAQSAGVNDIGPNHVALPTQP